VPLMHLGISQEHTLHSPVVSQASSATTYVPGLLSTWSSNSLQPVVEHHIGVTTTRQSHHDTHLP